MLTEGFIKLCFCLTYSDELTDRVQDRVRAVVAGRLVAHGVCQEGNGRRSGLWHPDALHMSSVFFAAKRDSFGTAGQNVVSSQVNYCKQKKTSSHPI